MSVYFSSSLYKKDTYLKRKQFNRKLNSDIFTSLVLTNDQKSTN